jgi:hypothetical protein
MPVYKRGDTWWYIFSFAVSRSLAPKPARVNTFETPGSIIY